MATVIIPNFLTEKVVDGLNTYQYTVASAAVHNCRIKMDHQPSSTMTISIVKAASVNATLATVTLAAVPDGPSQNTTILQAMANCAVNDTISFVITSSETSDKQLNTIKA